VFDASITAEDWAFIRAMLDVPEDRNTWLVYADWLDDRGDPRAEFLRLSNQLRDTAIGNPERTPIELRLGELRHALDPRWIMAFLPAPVGNCAGSRCERAWTDLRATDLPDVRLCPQCKHAVHYCHTIEEARAFASCGARVAITNRVPLEAVNTEPIFRYSYAEEYPPEVDLDQLD
jgi:uncharacterized protein (TIGR02996 family)